MSNCRKPKWYIELINQAKSTKKIDVGSSMIFDLDALSWKHVLSGYIEREKFDETLKLVVAIHLNTKKFNEASFTSALSANVFLFLLCASKYACCWVVVSELTVYIASTLFDSQIPSHIGTIGVQEFKKYACKIQDTL